MQGWRGGTERAEWITLTLVLAVPAIFVTASDWLLEVSPAIYLIGMTAMPAMLLVGLVLCLTMIWRRHWLKAAAIALGFALILLAPLPAIGSSLWFRISFQTNRAAYEEVVQRAHALPQSGALGDVRYQIERGPPTRIAFPQPVGIADNWGAVIHDPSDAVLTARGWGAEGAGDFTVRADLQRLWGGDLLSCARITGHWHRCWFT
ncbi:MAG: hypothetical protein ACT6TH_03970 [Brevundimonas sp.]|uniref:hypothetical protein n=1 Tax=Brevundimonas sp. TaxID=1871086 RepID=UPI004034003D